MRPVNIAITEVNFTAINTGGVNPGELVVTDGQDKLQANTKVEIKEGPGPAGQQRQKPEQTAETTVQ